MPTFDVSLIHNAKFQVTKFREGYDMVEVDDYLDRIAAAAQSGPQEIQHIIADIPTAKFQVTKFREGYDMVEVDDLLDTVLLALRNYLAQGGTGGMNGQAPYGTATTPLHDAPPAATTPRQAPRLMASDVIPPNFNTTKLSPGYSKQSVDSFFRDLQRIVAMGREEELLGIEDKVVNRNIPKTGPFSAGYSAKEVNNFLDGLLRTIRN
ncbi:DivIVA domain-containing protein [Jonesia quinghaiensis]|uniref:DivIVA domain-containing protein n=1 Tax=Jonesia quinghaiensis TaxID=262806 RepID=UPI000422798C|nr:DivIVA domain-containing protein [Jonesia quinghaiensis]